MDPAPDRLPEQAGRAQTFVLVVATAIALALCFWLVRPFVSVFAWAAALGIVGRPLHDAIARRVSNPDLAAGLAVGIVGLVIIGPVSFVLYRIGTEAAANAGLVQAGAVEETVDQLEAIPWLADLVRWARENLEIESAIRQIAGYVARHATGFVAGSIWIVVQVLLVLFTLYFVFRDRPAVVRSIRSLMPLSDSEADDVLRRVADTIHATIYGSLFVALIQGTMGGFMFWLLGLPSPVIWGLIMSLLAVVPNLGTFVIWGPAAVILALSGHWGKALVLACWGGIAIGFIDNLLYPYLVGHRMRLHTLAVFYAILGGVLALGAAGVVLGPVILVITLALMDVWRRRTTHIVTTGASP